MSSMGLFETSAIMVSETWTPVKDEKIHNVFQSSEDLLIGISTSTHGWYIKKNLCSFVLLAGGLGLLTESVSELPGKKKDIKYRKVFKKLPYHFGNIPFDCLALGEVESMIKFQQEFDTENHSTMPIAPAGHVWSRR